MKFFTIVALLFLSFGLSAQEIEITKDSLIINDKTFDLGEAILMGQRYSDLFKVKPEALNSIQNCTIENSTQQKNMSPEGIITYSYTKKSKEFELTDCKAISEFTSLIDITTSKYFGASISVNHELNEKQARGYTFINSGEFISATKDDTNPSPLLSQRNWFSSNYIFPRNKNSFKITKNGDQFVLLTKSGHEVTINNQEEEGLVITQFGNLRNIVDRQVKHYDDGGFKLTGLNGLYLEVKKGSNNPNVFFKGFKTVSSVFTDKNGQTCKVLNSDLFTTQNPFGENDPYDKFLIHKTDASLAKFLANYPGCSSIDISDLTNSIEAK